MSTIGSPISVSFLTVLTLGQSIVITALDQDGNAVDPGPLTFNSDNSSVIVTTDPSAPNSFFLNGVQGSPVTANVTFTDASGDTVVVTATTTDPVAPTSVTLVATAGAAV